MKKLAEAIDPYRQSFIYFQWSFWSMLCFASVVCWLFANAQGAFVKAALDNIFVYLPNYLIHEFSHRFWCLLRYWSYP